MYNLTEAHCGSWRKLSRRTIFAGLCAIVLCAGNAHAKPEALEVDSVWSGIRVHYSAVSVGPYVYIGYYDADRELTVAMLDTANGEVKKKKLGSRFKGWDNHNSIAMAYDKYGYLHLAGNMHASPLVYGRMKEPGNFDSFAMAKSMVGNDESLVTYPKFFKMPDGSLGFSYRSGRSGDGEEIIDRFDGKAWQRHSDQPIFSAGSSGPDVNAYHSGYISGPDGYFHVAWVWRLEKMSETNFNVNYAKSKDLIHWVDSKGNAISLPITPANAEVVDKVPPRSGIYNNVHVGFDAKGIPVISYLKFDKDGFTQLYHAKSVDDKWVVRKMTDWNYRWQFGGAGTLVEEISFSGVAVKNGQLVETIRHRKEGELLATYDDTALQVEKMEHVSKKPSSACKNLKPWSQAEVAIEPATKQSFKGKVIWRSLGRDNNDQPRSCSDIGEKGDCSFATKLAVIPSSIAAGADGATLACNL